MNASRFAVGFVTIGLALPSHGGLQFTNVASNVSAALYGTAYGGVSNFVAVGSDSTAVSATYTGNELIWLTAGMPVAGLALYSAAYGGGMLLAGGQSASVFSSTNGTDWVQRNNAFSISVTVRGLAFNNGRFVAVGSTPAISYTDAGVSAWTTATIVAPSFLESYRGVTPLGASGFAVCGVRGLIRTSLDGTTWSAVRVLNTQEPDLLGIAAGGGNLVCVGAGGRIMVSPDNGTNWAFPNYGSGNLNAVAYTGTEFIVVGDGGLILTSPDGTNWSANASPTAANLRGLVFATSGDLQGVGVLAGDNGTVIIGGTPPPAPAYAVNQTNCAGLLPNTALMASNVPDGAHPAGTVAVDWYDAPAGGSPLTNNWTTFMPTNTRTGTYNYYAQARDLRTGFVSTNRVEVQLVVEPCPNTLSIRLVGSNAVVQWYGNYVLQCSSNLVSPWIYTTQGLGGINNYWTAPVFPPSPANNFFRLYGPTD